MTEPTLDPAWGRLFDSFEYSARRLEVRDSYARPDEDAGYRRFLAGAADDPAYGEGLRDWTEDVVGRAVRAGKSFSRVRVVRDPPTDYQRFGLRNARWNVAGGEDIRYLTRLAFAGLHLPNYDFWLFDERQLVVLHFTDADDLLGGYVVTAPAVVRQHGRWLDAAWQAATPYAAFLTARPDWSRPPGMASSL